MGVLIHTAAATQVGSDEELDSQEVESGDSSRKASTRRPGPQVDARPQLASTTAGASSSSGVTGGSFRVAAEDTKVPYEESPSAMQRLFAKFDIKHDGYITTDELSVVMKSLHLYPTSKDIRNIIAEVDKDKDGKVGIQEFVEMRLSGAPTQFNILAEFKKYDISPDHRGFITADSIRKVLTNEGCRRDVVEQKTEELMRSDSNADGKVSFRDLYEFMTERVPDEWLEWIHINVQRGVDTDAMIQIMKDNGFHPEVAEELVLRTEAEGRLEAERGYADSAKAYVYCFRS